MRPAVVSRRVPAGAPPHLRPGDVFGPLRIDGPLRRLDATTWEAPARLGRRRRVLVDIGPWCPVADEIRLLPDTRRARRRLGHRYFALAHEGADHLHRHVTDERENAMRLGAVTIDTNDLDRAAGFWSAVTGCDAAPPDGGYVSLAAPDGGGTALGLQLVPEPRQGKNRLHLDLFVGDVDAEVDRVTRLGATVVRRHDGWVVLADPDGNEFCLVAA